MSLKLIWKIDFLDIIFAEENTENEFRTITTILIYSTIHKMDFNKNTHIAKLSNASFYSERLAIQVHEYGQ